MGKKKNNDLRQIPNETRTQRKEKDYLVNTGIDEDLADEMTKTKRKRKGGN